MMTSWRSYWPSYLKAHPAKEQIIVDQDLLEDVAELLGELATKLKVARNEVMLIGAALGNSIGFLVG
jgi:tetrahydromethanopterin S-methyltransferase subunit G